MTDPVDTQLAAYNARDTEAFLVCFTVDCIVEDGAGNRLLTGKAEMRPRYAAMFAASPNLHCEILHRTRIGDYVIDEERISGRNPPTPHAVAIYHLVETAAGLKIGHIRFYRPAQT